MSLNTMPSLFIKSWGFVVFQDINYIKYGEYPIKKSVVFLPGGYIYWRTKQSNLFASYKNTVSITVNYKTSSRILSRTDTSRRRRFHPGPLKCPLT